MKPCGWPVRAMMSCGQIINNNWTRNCVDLGFQHSDAANISFYFFRILSYAPISRMCLRGQTAFRD